MTWLKRYQLRTFLASSLWVVPVTTMILALALAPLLRRVDQATQWELFGFGLRGAQAVVSGLVASVFTFLVFVFSLLLVAVQIASTNLSPRVIAGLLAHRPVRLCLGLMIFTFVYGLAVIARIEATVPQLPVAIVIAASLASIVSFVGLIDHMSRQLRPVSVLSRVGHEGAHVIASIYPHALVGSTAPVPGYGPIEGPTRDVRSSEGGVVLAFDAAGLAAAALAADAVLELVPRVGDFVAAGDPLLRIHGGRGALDDGALLQCVALGAERTVEQDPAFPFRIIVDIAAKALSPAVNDPTTAVLSIDQIHHLLRDVGSRRLDPGMIRDHRGHPRLVYRTPSWEDFVVLAVTEIRHFGSGSIQVARRLRAMLDDLIATLPAERRPAIAQELRLLERSAERAFSDPEDQARARCGDAQGIGGGTSGAGLGAG